MKAGRVELFINVMWRELDMLTAGARHSTRADARRNLRARFLANGSDWRRRGRAARPRDSAHGARYWRQVHVRRANGDRWPGYWYVCSTSQTLTMDET